MHEERGAEGAVNGKEKGKSLTVPKGLEPKMAGFVTLLYVLRYTYPMCVNALPPDLGNLLEGSRDPKRGVPPLEGPGGQRSVAAA